MRRHCNECEGTEAMIKRWRGYAVMLGVLSVSAGALLSGCGETKYAVGDCVTIKMKTLDQEMKSADCPSGSSNTSLGNPVYKVDRVIDGANGSCGGPTGFGAVEFSDQPADATYCLSFAR